MKKSVKLIIAIVLLLVAIGVFWVVQNKGPKDEVVQTEYITTASSDDLYRYAYSKDGQMYSFTCDSEKGWSYDGDNKFRLDGAKLSVVIQNLWKTSVTRVLTDVDDASFEEFGLANPVGEISITLKDGSIQNFHVGNTNSTAGAVYLYKDDDTKTVYLVSSDISSAFNKALDSLEGSKGITGQDDDES